VGKALTETERNVELLARYRVVKNILGDLALDNRQAQRKLPQVLPLLMVYRSQDDGIFGTEKLVLTGRKGVIDNRLCYIMSCGDNLIWVDPTRDFVPTRFRWIGKGATLQAIDIKYAPDSQHGWVPTSWTVVLQHSSGDPIMSDTMSVVEYRIGLALSDETFKVEFVPGTFVDDQMKGTSYILRQGGVQRSVLPGEYNGHNYKDLLEQEPARFRQSHWMFIGMNGAFLSLIIVAVMLNRIRTRRSMGRA
jgi:hypothetical protein